MPQYLSTDPNAGEPEMEFRQGQPQAWYEGAWEAARQAIFGSPDRAEARAAGMGLQPTPAEMADAGLQMASVLGGPAAGAAALNRVRGPVGAAAKWVIGHPRATAAAVGAVPGVLDQSPKEAVIGAVLGGTVGSTGKAVDAVRRAKDLRAAGKNAEARAIIEALRREAPEAAPAAVSTVTRAAAAEAAPVAAKAAPAVSTAVDRGKAAVEKHRSLVEFAKEAAKANPKMGQKIWMLLDDSGAPVKLLTPDQAGAAARKGLKTTWIKNLWGSTAGAFAE